MKNYRVMWEIDIDASSPRKAAKEALEIQRDKGSEATFFTVRDNGSGEVFNIDLEKE